MPATIKTGRRRASRLLLATVAGVIALDAISKIAVDHMLGPGQERHEIRVIPSLLELRYGRNTGISFGLLQGETALVWGLLLFAVAGVGALIWSMMSDASDLTAVALGLIAGGGLANLLNRIFSGHVIDFIELWRWPAFNIADAALTIGIIVLAATMLLGNRSAASQVLG
jgi:signal peptidase II